MNCLLCSNVMQKMVEEQYLDSYVCEFCGYRCSKKYTIELCKLVGLNSDSMPYGRYLISRNRVINYTIVFNNGDACYTLNRYISDDEYIAMCKRFQRLVVLS